MLEQIIKTTLLDQKILFLELNNPLKNNALSLKMLNELINILSEENLSSNYRILVFKGLKDTPFSAGADLNEIKVVKVPAPAIKGKATGTIVPLESSGEDLNISIPKIISNPIKKITIAPAIAKEVKSIPIKFNICSPKKRKDIMITPETKVALND